MTPHIVKPAEETQKLKLELQPHDASAIEGFLQAYAATCKIWGGYHSPVQFVLTEVNERITAIDMQAQVGKITLAMELAVGSSR